MATAQPKKIAENLVTCQFCGCDFYAFPSANRVCCSSQECKREMASKRSKRHGQSNSRLHNIWCGMKSRCNGTSNKLGREYYKDRGISVCDEWIASFEAFRDWALRNGYDGKKEIDRRDNSKGYSPENCRWATRSQQMRNTRKRRDAKTSKFRGVSKHSQNQSWVAQGHRNGRPIHLGSFSAEVLAAVAYDDWAHENYGEFASLNFPERKEVYFAYPVSEAQ